MKPSPKLYLFVLIFLLTPLAEAKKEKKRPNVILIVADTLRADYLGCYGFRGNVSPWIDKLARRSFVFNRAIAPSPWTKPSIASLFTSLHPQTHKVVDHLGMHWKKVNKRYKTSVLSEEAVTLAEVLLYSGYQTWGFVGNDFLIRRFGYGQGFERYFEPRPDTDVFSATPLLNKAVKLLKKKEVKKPYFMYFHFMDTHGPYQCQGGDFEAMLDSPSIGENVRLTWKQRRRIPRELSQNISWRGSEMSLDVNNWRACYAAGVKKFDRRLGAFLEKIEKMGVLEDTLLIFTSDHGEELYDHRAWAHSHTLYTELLRVPLIIRLPGKRGKRGMVKETVSLLDIMPTILSMASVDFKMEGLYGRDISPLFKGKKAPGPKLAFGTATRHKPDIVSVQNNRYKMIWDFPKGTPKLFDLKKDPLEKKDIAHLKPYWEKKFRKTILTHIKELRAKGTLIESSLILSNERVEKLKSLGYLQ